MRTGESLALFGTGGAGKSLLGRIVAGLERATTGSLEFDARVYRGTDLSPINRGDIGYVFRQARTAFDPRLPVGLSIAEPLRLDLDRGIDDPDIRVRDTVAAFGLPPDLLTALPAELTDAQLQRFAVARALITRPKLVVLDEPVLDLDIGERSAFLILLDRLRADFGLSLLIATRDFDTVRVLADRVLVMDRGHVVETGTPAQLAAAPQHPVTQRLIGALLPEIGIVPIF
jgi:ABC-type glutathione transport system ATPase component